MIYVIAVSFSTLALQDEETTNFRESFELNYRNAYTDFGAEEDQYSKAKDLISFLVSSYFGPLVMLNLLISIMADTHAQALEQWPVEEIRGTYSVAQEVLCFISTFQTAKLSCKSKSIFSHLTEEKGYIHYCIPAPTYAAQDKWQGQANEIEAHVRRTEHRILYAINNRGENLGTTSAYSSPVKVQNDALGPQVNKRIETMERSINSRHEALERSISGKYEDLERNVKDLDSKMNRVLDLLQK